jgi:hypothetical protein
MVHLTIGQGSSAHECTPGRRHRASFRRLLRYRVTRGILGAFVSAALSVVTTSTAAAQRTEIRVTVRDSLSGLTLPGVAIATGAGQGPVAVTDTSGAAVARVAASTVRLYFSKIGYEPAEQALSMGDSGRVDVAVTMLRISIPIEGVAVEAKWIDVPPRLREFEQRREAGRAGTYFTREQIVKRNTNRLTDLLRGISSVRIVDSAGVKAAASSRSVLPRTGDRGGAELRYCLFRVVIDGNPKEVGFPLDALEPNEVHGIEVYSGPGTVPSQYASFGRDANCGVILVWTR